MEGERERYQAEKKMVNEPLFDDFESMLLQKLKRCCVFQPANGCFTHNLLVEIIFLPFKHFFCQTKEKG